MTRVSRARRALLAGAAAAVAAGCAGFGPREAVQVAVVGLDPLPGEGFEGRFLLKLRVQNPNDAPIDYDGIAVELELRGRRLATGVSDARGTVPRFGEAVLAVPISVSAVSVLRQFLGVAGGLGGGRADYRLRGRLAGPAFGSTPFDVSGELTLPGPPAERGPR